MQGRRKHIRTPILRAGEGPYSKVGQGPGCPRTRRKKVRSSRTLRESKDDDDDAQLARVT